MDFRADKFYEYLSQGWYSLSSPVWANFGLKRGLPISCFGSYIDDSIDSIMYTTAEVGVMSKYGGGTSAYFGGIRGRGSLISNNGKSNGSFPFAKMFDTTIDVVSQGSTRRGYFAGYIDVEHPDVEEWLEIMHEGNPIQLMYYGVAVGNQWLEEMKEGDKGKRRIWAKILQNRVNIGVPYIFFKDNANDQRPEVYKELGMTIFASNLCSEIMLPSSPQESFVCCLSSMNLKYYDEWKHTDAVEYLIYFLDAVMEEFIQKTEGVRFMERANRFAKRHRALGLGVLGYHDLLQSKMIPFDSFEAAMVNGEVFRTIRTHADAASEYLAEKLGEPQVMTGRGKRNSTLMALAPTKSSSFILEQVSQTIEPIKSNYHIKDTAKMKITYQNPALLRHLALIGKNTVEVWESIRNHDGSVQQLDCLSDHAKNVFKTASEISQLAIVQQAAQRQRWVDQGQSLNLFIHPDTPTKDINQLYLTAAKLGVKSLYYQMNVNAAQEFSRDLLTCSSCEA